MSLADHIRAQEERAHQLGTRLDALAAEFAEQMRAFGVEPYPVLEATGEYRQKSEWDMNCGDVTRTTVLCQMSGVDAWALQSQEICGLLNSSPYRSNDLRRHVLAITTEGKLLLTESCGLDYREHIMCANSYLHDCFVYRGAMGILRSSSWEAARERDQHNILIDWAEKAYTEGHNVITRPIEMAMLHQYNELRRR